MSLLPPPVVNPFSALPVRRSIHKLAWSEFEALQFKTNKQIQSLTPGKRLSREWRFSLTDNIYGGYGKKDQSRAKYLEILLSAMKTNDGLFRIKTEAISGLGVNYKKLDSEDQVTCYRLYLMEAGGRIHYSAKDFVIMSADRTLIKNIHADLSNHIFNQTKSLDESIKWLRGESPYKELVGTLDEAVKKGF